MKKILVTLLGLGAVLAMPELLAADEDLTGAVGRWTGHLNAFGGLFKIVVGFAGAIFAFMGIVGLKKYADDSRQNPLMKPMIMFLAGAAALGFVGITGMLSKTVTTEDQESSVLKS
jgi:hypothetical protein